MLIKTTEYNTKLITTFINWYFIEMPVKMFKYITEYIAVISYMFSFIFLLKTLLYPWKNQLYAYPKKGFDIQLIIQVFTSNMFARIIGAIIRMTTIFTGILVLITFSMTALLIVLIWFLFPLLAIGIFIYSFFL